jgi:hypothetical protein
MAWSCLSIYEAAISDPRGGFCCSFGGSPRGGGVGGLPVGRAVRGDHPGGAVRPGRGGGQQRVHGHVPLRRVPARRAVRVPRLRLGPRMQLHVLSEPAARAPSQRRRWQQEHSWCLRNLLTFTFLLRAVVDWTIAC